MGIIWRVTSWERERGKPKGEKRGKGAGVKKHKRQEQNRQGEVKNSMGKGETRELTHRTHGHELRWGVLHKGLGILGGGGQRGKNWDNCHSIINKMYLKPEKTIARHRK